MGHFPLWHVCVWMHVCGGQKTTWVNFSFCLEGSEDWTQIIRLSGKHLYLLTHLSDQSCVHVQKFTLIFLFFVYFRRFGNPFCVIKKLSWLCLNLPSLSWVLNLYASNFFTWKKNPLYWVKPRIPGFGRLREEDHSGVSLGQSEILSQTNNNKRAGDLA